MDANLVIAQVFTTVIMTVSKTIVPLLIPGNHAYNKRFKARFMKIVRRLELSILVVIDSLLVFILYGWANSSPSLMALDAICIAFLTTVLTLTLLLTVRSILR
jgi:CO dehydrogenase/acetyl-CoA synthase epsilon subunit